MQRQVPARGPESPDCSGRRDSGPRLPPQLRGTRMRWRQCGQANLNVASGPGAFTAEPHSGQNPGPAGTPVPHCSQIIPPLLKLLCPIPFQYYSINRSQKQYRTPEIS